MKQYNIVIIILTLLYVGDAYSGQNCSCLQRGGGCHQWELGLLGAMKMTSCKDGYAYCINNTDCLMADHTCGHTITKIVYDSKLGHCKNRT